MIDDTHFLSLHWFHCSKSLHFQCIFSYEKSFMHILFICNSRWNPCVYGVCNDDRCLHSSPNLELRAFRTDSFHYVERLYLMWPSETLFFIFLLDCCEFLHAIRLFIISVIEEKHWKIWLWRAEDVQMLCVMCL